MASRCDRGHSVDHVGVPHQGLGQRLRFMVGEVQPHRGHDLDGFRAGPAAQHGGHARRHDQHAPVLQLVGLAAQPLGQQAAGRWPRPSGCGRCCPCRQRGSSGWPAAARSSPARPRRGGFRSGCPRRGPPRKALRSGRARRPAPGRSGRPGRRAPRWAVTASGWPPRLALLRTSGPASIRSTSSTPRAPARAARWSAWATTHSLHGRRKLPQQALRMRRRRPPSVTGPGQHRRASRWARLLMPGA